MQTKRKIKELEARDERNGVKRDAQGRVTQVGAIPIVAPTPERMEELMRAASGEEPTSAEWLAFLETPEGRGMTADERRWVARQLAPEGGRAPDVECFRLLLRAFRACEPEQPRTIEVLGVTCTRQPEGRELADEGLPGNTFWEGEAYRCQHDPSTVRVLVLRLAPPASDAIKWHVEIATHAFLAGKDADQDERNVTFHVIGNGPTLADAARGAADRVAPIVGAVAMLLGNAPEHSGDTHALNAFGVKCVRAAELAGDGVIVWTGYGDRMRVTIELYPGGTWCVGAFVQRGAAHEGSIEAEGWSFMDAHWRAAQRLRELLASFNG